MANANKTIKLSPFLLAIIITPILIACATISSFQLVENQLITPFEQRQQQHIADALGSGQLQLFDHSISLLKSSLQVQAKLAGSGDIAETSLKTRLIPAEGIRVLSVKANLLTLYSHNRLLNNIEADVVNKTISSQQPMLDTYRLDNHDILLMSIPVIKTKQVSAILLAHYDLAQLAELSLADSNNASYRFSFKGRPIASKGSIDEGGLHALQHSRVVPKLTLSTQSPAEAPFDSNSLTLLSYLVAALISSLSLIGYLLISRTANRRPLPPRQPLPAGKPPQHNDTSEGNPISASTTTEEVKTEDSSENRSLESKNTAAINAVSPPPASPVPVDEGEEILLLPDKSIFRAYDIRGIADSQLDAANCRQIGRAIGSSCLDHQQHNVAVGYDGRLSSPAIKQAVIEGLLSTGVNVLDIGAVATPLLYFTTHLSEFNSGVMITGSHNPAEYNGLKIVIDQKSLHGEQIQALYQRIESNNFATGEGEISSRYIDDDYIDCISTDIAIAQPLKIVIDCGNGIAGKTAPKLFTALNCEVIPLYCEVDGNFPNHHPDPSVSDNMIDLIAAVQEHNADLGVAFDGDGDRLGAVDQNGNLISPDQLLMLFAQDVVSRNPGTDVVFDVKCSRHLNTLIHSCGGRPIVWKSGHSLIKEKMRATGALLGGEFTGHFFFKERWFGFDDGLYSAARLIEILSTGDVNLSELIAHFPVPLSTPEIIIKVEDSVKFTIIEELIDTGDYSDGKILTIDGLRVDYPDGWGLVRASNTTAALTFRFEGDNQDVIDRIQRMFQQQLLMIKNKIIVNF